MKKMSLLTVNWLSALIDFVLKDRKNCVFISKIIKLHIEYASWVLAEFITEFILSMLWLRLMRIIITWLNYNSVLTLSRMKSFCWQAPVESSTKDIFSLCKHCYFKVSP